jgi:hypothetical protein
MKGSGQIVWITITVVILGALVIGLWSYQEPSPTLEVKETIAKRIITIEAEGDSSHQIEKFKKTYKVNADNFSVEYIKEKNSTLLRCDVHGKFTGNWYDFHWFLNPIWISLTVLLINLKECFPGKGLLTEFQPVLF